MPGKCNLGGNNGIEEEGKPGPHGNKWVTAGRIGILME